MSGFKGQLRRLLEPIVSRLKGLVVAGWVQQADDGPALQQLDVEAPGDDRARVERVQNYGLSSVPLPGAQAILVSVGSNRSQATAIAVDDRRYRPLNLQPGDVVLYNDQGTTVHLGRNGQLLINAGGGITLQCGQTSINLQPDGAALVCGSTALTLEPTKATLSAESIELKKAP